MEEQWNDDVQEMKKEKEEKETRGVVLNQVER